jgi:transposase InsO family protein
VVIKAADEFTDKTTAPNQLWQTDFTYLKVIGWGWFYLSTILDDYSRCIIAWKLCTNMKADDVTATLTLALEASGCNRDLIVPRRDGAPDSCPSLPLVCCIRTRPIQAAPLPGRTQRNQPQHQI